VAGDKNKMTIDDFLKMEKVESAPIAQEEKEQGILMDTLDGVIFVADEIDSLTGAPTRAAVRAAQEGDNPVSAFIDQFGRDTSKAPTGQDIVRRTSIFDKDSAAEVVMGFAADVMIDPTAAMSATVKLTGKALKSFATTAKIMNEVKDITRVKAKAKAAKSAFKAVAQNSTTEVVDSALRSKGDVVIGRALMDRGMGPHLNNPPKLLDKIKGTQKYKTIEAAGPDGVIDHFEKVATRSGDGAISKISRETDSLLESAVENGAEQVDVKTLGDVLLERFSKEAVDPTTGEAWDPKYVEEYKTLFDKHVIKTDPAVYRRGIEPPTPGKFKVGIPKQPEIGNFRSVSEVQKLKRGIGKQISDAEFAAGIEPKDAMKLRVLKDIYHSLNPMIEHAVRDVVIESAQNGAKMPMAFMIKKNNADVSALMEVSEMVSKTRANVLINNDTAQALMAGGASVVTAASLVASGMMSPTTAALISGGAGAVVGSRSIAKVLPKLSAQAAEFISKGKVSKNIHRAAAAGGSARAVSSAGRERLKKRKGSKK